MELKPTAVAYVIPYLIQTLMLVEQNPAPPIPHPFSVRNLPPSDVGLPGFARPYILCCWVSSLLWSVIFNWNRISWAGVMPYDAANTYITPMARPMLDIHQSLRPS